MAIKSPFPGMDPYLEQHWRDVHARLITYTADALQSQLPTGLRARMEERIVVEPTLGQPRGVYPDVRVIEHGRGQNIGREAGSVALADVAIPFIMKMKSEPATENFIEIIDIGSGGEVVTVIEMLSFTNKLPGKGQDAYLEKQRELIQGDVNLVEIDLLRAGKRILAFPGNIPDSYRTTYNLCVYRSSTDDAELYGAPLRMRLPVINVPLRPTDADARLDIQALVDTAYKNGGYDDLDYTRDPEPPLEPADAEWAAALLIEKGLRPATPR